MIFKSKVVLADILYAETPASQGFLHIKKNLKTIKIQE